MDRLKTLLMAERMAFPLWTPVILGFGVQIYFWLRMEPAIWTLIWAPILPVLIWAVGWRQLRHVWLLGAVLLLIGSGFALSGLRAHLVAAPVLTEQADATVEGTIRELSRTRTGRPRLVLDDLTIYGTARLDTPRRAQIALLREVDVAGLVPGDRVSVFTHLGPPGGPVEPGGFDFRRDAWFKGLGAIGYARGAPVVIAAERTPGILRKASLRLARLRANISAALRAELPGETGAFAAAVIVGDRAGISNDSTEALRASNLSHLLAISGLHMGLVTALMFGAARLILAAIPLTGRRWRTKRIAAVIALVAASAYLLLSGASVATQRAYIMAFVALVAIMLNRPAITLRALAVAALVILVIRPESLVQVGFQMSFAATAAIIAGFDYARAQGWTDRFTGGGPGKRFVGYVVALAATSLLAGLATAPFAAFHFNRIAHYGLLANLAAVPVMGFWVAPSALVAGALAPFGLESIALHVMGRGIETIMTVARFVSGLDGATSPVRAGPGIVLALVTFGGLMLCLGRTVLRAGGFAACMAGFAIWAFIDTRPPVLIAPEGRLMGVMTPEGRALDHPKTQSYAAGSWLTGDGDNADQATAAARGGFAEGYAGSVAQLGNGWTVMNVLSRNPAPASLSELCLPLTLILAPGAMGAVDGPCEMLVGRDLLARGALALWPQGDDLRIVSAEDVAGDRLWTGSLKRAEARAALGATSRQ